MLTKLHPYIINLSVIKRFALNKTYLQFLYLILSIEHYLIKRKNLKLLYIWFVSIIIFMGISMAERGEFSAPEMLKWIQLFIMVSTIPFIFELFKKNINIITYLSALLSLVEAIAGKLLGYEKFINVILGMSFPRIQGIVGEPNFSALFLFTAYLFNKERSKYLLIPFIFLTGSKTTIILVIMFTMVSLFPNFIKDAFKKIALAGFVLYPLISYCGFKYSNNETREILTNLTSHRFSIHYIYVTKSFDNLFGDGLKTNVEKVHNERPQEVIDFLKYSKIDLVHGEQHSLPIEILYKFGVIVFTIFCGYLITMRNRINFESLFVLLNLINLNGLFEISTFLILSMLFWSNCNEG